jgi:iron complex transport system substrate-binding protein
MPKGYARRRRPVGRAVTAALLVIFSFFSLPRWGEAFERIVSLAPSMTETLYALGLGEKVVGVTVFCDQPPEARGKPKIGGMSNPSLEAVYSLRPDIVVMTMDGNPKEFEDRLRALGIRTYVSRARSIHEFPMAVREMGSALGAVQKADELAMGMDKRMEGYRAARPGVPERVLFIVWPEPLIVAGPGTAVDDAIRLLGHENAAVLRGEDLSRYPKYSIEEVIRRKPDVILIGRGHEDIRRLSERLLERLGSTPAVRNGKVFFLSDRLYRLGPRVMDGIGEMAESLGGVRDPGRVRDPKQQ